MIQSMTVQDLSSHAGARFGFSLLNRKASGTKGAVPRQAKQGAKVFPPISAITERDAQQTQEAQLLAAEVRLAKRGDACAMARLIETNRTWIRGISYSVL